MEIISSYEAVTIIGATDPHYCRNHNPKNAKKFQLLYFFNSWA